MMKLLQHIFIALLLGCGISLYLLQNDTLFKEYITTHYIDLLAKVLKCELTGTVSSINFFTLELELSPVIANTPEKTWLWHAEKCTIRCSWLSLLLSQRACITLAFDTVRITSMMHIPHIAFVASLKALLQSESSSFVTITQVSIYNGQLLAEDQSNQVTYKGNFALECRDKNKQLTIQLSHPQGTLCYKNNAIATTEKTMLVFNKKASDIHSSIVTTCIITDTNNRKELCYLQGIWDNNTGTLKVNNKNGSLYIAATADISQSFHSHIQAQMPSEILQALLSHLGLLRFPVGTLNAELFTLKEKEGYSYHGTLILQDLLSYIINQNTMNMSFVGDQNRVNGMITTSINTSEPIVIRGDWDWDYKNKKGSYSLLNSTTISHPLFPDYAITSSQFSLQGTVNAELQARGEFNAHITDKSLIAEITPAGTFQFNNNELSLTGSMQGKSCDCVLKFTPHPWIKKFLYKNEHNRLLCLVKEVPGALHICEGFMDYECLGPLIASVLPEKIPGSGIIEFKSSLQDFILSTSLHLVNARIGMPGVYNSIHTGRASVVCDYRRKQIAIKKLELMLDRGTIATQGAIISFNEQNELLFGYMPCIVNKLFINKDNDFFIILSGQLLLEKLINDIPLVRGTIILDKGQLKQNILSQTSQKEILAPSSYIKHYYAHNINFDITLASKNPLSVKTSFLQTNAQLSFALKGDLHNPQMSGSIDLYNGTLSFPYQPLHIESGKIYFLSHQVYDPIVELHAKGRIRKYHINMHVDGSLQHPHISFDSTPPLSEEQIITLLLSGNQDGALSLAMPSLIMQHLHKLIFGPEQPQSKLEAYFNTLLSPLQHVRIVPGFTGQTGRGGFRGSIEIDVDNQFHGVIQKNFSLPEDTRFEVEYLLSDDMSIRGIKDERGDIGGEIEMRFKF